MFHRLSDIIGHQEVNKIKQKLQSTYHQQIAVDIAEGLNDMKHIGWYMRICKQNPHMAKRIYNNVAKKMNIKNKGAYFTFLWNQSKKNSKQFQKPQKQ